MSALSLLINDKPQDIQSDDQRKFSAPRGLSSHVRQLVWSDASAEPEIRLYHDVHDLEVSWVSSGKVWAEFGHLQDAEFYKRFALDSFYHLASTIIELTVANFSCQSLMLLTQIKQILTNQMSKAPRSPSALEVGVLGLVLAPRTPTANRLPTDWRSGRVQVKAGWGSLKMVSHGWE